MGCKILYQCFSCSETATVEIGDMYHGGSHFCLFEFDRGHGNRSFIHAVVEYLTGGGTEYDLGVWVVGTELLIKISGLERGFVAEDRHEANL